MTEICAKPPSKNEKRPLPVDVRRSKTLLLKLIVTFRGGVARGGKGGLGKGVVLFAHIKGKASAERGIFSNRLLSRGI